MQEWKEWLSLFRQLLTPSSFPALDAVMLNLGIGQDRQSVPKLLQSTDDGSSREGGEAISSPQMQQPFLKGDLLLPINHSFIVGAVCVCVCVHACMYVLLILLTGPFSENPLGRWLSLTEEALQPLNMFLIIGAFAHSNGL